MKVFVSGATSSIGAHLVKFLSERGYTIHVFLESLSEVNNLKYNHIIPFEGDITNKESVEVAMAGCSQAYHLAAFTKVWSRFSSKYYDVNVKGTIHVLQAALNQKVKKIVITSTASVYGPSISEIVTEEKVRETDFFNEYEGSKALAESKIKDFVNNYNLNVVIVSPTRVYGPFIFGKPTAATLLIEKYVNNSWRIYPGSGRELGNYVYIEDVALGHILAMEKGKKGHTYILGGQNFDYVTFFDKLRKLSGVKRKLYRIPLWVQLLFAKVQLLLANLFGKEPLVTPKWIAKGRYNWEVSPQKAVKELGLPIMPLEEGLSKTVDYVKSLKKLKLMNKKN